MILNITDNQYGRFLRAKAATVFSAS